jgi:hypothetical protein
MSGSFHVIHLKNGTIYSGVDDSVWRKVKNQSYFFFCLYEKVSGKKQIIEYLMTMFGA